MNNYIKCKNCGKKFKCGDNRIKYCSDLCFTEFATKRNIKSVYKKRSKRFTPEMNKMFVNIEIKQQKLEDIILDKCGICGSDKNLFLHFIVYYPIPEYIILCYKCHSFLHKSKHIINNYKKIVK